MLSTYPACLIESFPKKKPKQGFLINSINVFGFMEKLHSFDDVVQSCSLDTIYMITVDEVEIPHTNGRTYKVLKSFNKIGYLDDPNYRNANSALTAMHTWFFQTDNLRVLVGRSKPCERSPQWDLEQGVKRYIDNPNRFKEYDKLEVWDKVKDLRKDINELPGLKRDVAEQDWTKTFNETVSKSDRSKNLKVNETIEGVISSVDRSYRNKLSHLTVNGLKDPKLTRLTETPTTLIEDSNLYPKTGVIVYIDSAALQVAIKERHVSEIFAYFALITFMKKGHRFPNASVKNLVPFFETFLENKRLRKTGKAILHSLYRIGFINLSDKPKTARDIKLTTVVSIKSQQEYVSKYEAAWNGKQNNVHEHRQILYNGKERKKYDGQRKTVLISDKPDYSRCSLKLQIELSQVHKPYFDIYANKTCKMDTGFIHLINAGKPAMLRWLYEGVMSSLDYNVCRTRIQMNFLLARSTQRLLEKSSTTMLKRYNFLNISERMKNSLTSTSKVILKSRLLAKGRFKVSRSGQIYRQEGNSFKSEIFQWVSSKKCSHFRLSPRYIRLWQATRPAFAIKDVKGNRRTTLHATFKPISSKLIDGQSFKVYAKQKKEIEKGNYFALSKNGVAAISSNPEMWEGFEPFAEYDRFNGDFLTPATPSIKIYNAYGAGSLRKAEVGFGAFSGKVVKNTSNYLNDYNNYYNENNDVQLSSSGTFS